MRTLILLLFCSRVLAQDVSTINLQRATIKMIEREECLINLSHCDSALMYSDSTKQELTTKLDQSQSSVDAQKKVLNIQAGELEKYKSLLEKQSSKKVFWRRFAGIEALIVLIESGIIYLKTTI